jgi:hypothetical protein
MRRARLAELGRSLSTPARPRPAAMSAGPSERGGAIILPKRPKLKPGAAVRIISGPFARQPPLPPARANPERTCGRNQRLFRNVVEIGDGQDRLAALRTMRELLTHQGGRPFWRGGHVSFASEALEGPSPQAVAAFAALAGASVLAQPQVQPWQAHQRRGPTPHRQMSPPPRPIDEPHRRTATSRRPLRTRSQARTNE